MLVFEIVIALLLAGAGLTALSRRLGTPYPAMVALAGAGLALVPGVPTLILDPELALALFVAPVLLDAAFDSSPRDLRKNWRSVTGLAVGAVVLTVVAVALVARMLVPAMPWSVAVTIGAIVAPPDAAAATAVLKQLRPPHRLLVILEGESLFNDATALLVYRLAVSVAIATVPVSPMTAIPPLLLVTVVSVGLGLGLARAVITVISRIEDVAIAVVVQFCGAFAVWLIAERLHLSGVLTMVVFAMSAARRAGATTPARIRIPAYAVWEVAVFVLNVLAFILVGFQLKGILGRVDRPTLASYAIVAGAVCIAAIAARLVWVFAAAAFGRWRCEEGANDPTSMPSRNAAVMGWCGMRGIVTLATALALPAGEDGGPAFPYRDLVVFTAFLVVLGTLVLQGMTLRPLMSWLRLEDDGEVDHEVRLARVEMFRAALGAATGIGGEELGDVLRRRYTIMLRRAEAALARGEGGEEDGGIATEEAVVIRAALTAERRRLLALREASTIGDSAFQRLEEALDLEELHLQQLVPLAREEEPATVSANRNRE